MATFRKVLLFLAVLALFIGLARSANAQQMALTEKQLVQLFSTKVTEPIPATYNGKTTQIEYRKLEDRHKDWFKIIYIFFKPTSDEEWFFYQIHQETATDSSGESKNKVFARIFQITSRGPVILKGYASTSLQESFDTMRRFVEKKFKLSLPTDTKL